MTLPDSSRSRAIRGGLLRFVGAPGSLRARLIKSAGGTFVLKVTAIGLGFLTTLLLARVLGAAEYGAYAYAMAWLGLLGIPATLGFHQLLVRDVAIYHAQEEWGLLRGLLSFSNRLVLTVSIVLTAIAALAGWMLLGSRENNSMLLVFWVALLILPFSALTQLRQAAMRGFQQIILGQLPEMLIRPVLFMVMLGGAVFFFRQNLTAQLAVALNVVATVIAFAIGLYWLNKIRPIETKTANPQFRTRTWLGGALPLLVVGGMHVINSQADTIMLGAIKGASEVGIYAVIKKLVDLVVFILIAVNTSIAPTIARCYADGESERLQRIVSKSTRVISLATLPVAFGLIFFGDQVLLLFGAEFAQGSDALIILSLAQLVNAGMGSVGLILIMTHHERDAAIGIGIAASLNILLNAILIPLWGVNGAATATAMSTIVWNILLAIKVHQRIGIITTVLGK